MLDLVYVGGTVFFFAVMLLYVRACEAVGAEEKREGKTR